MGEGYVTKQDTPDGEDKTVELAERIRKFTQANETYAAENEKLQKEIVALKKELATKDQDKTYARAAFITIQDSLETLRRTVVLLQQGGEK